MAGSPSGGADPTLWLEFVSTEVMEEGRRVDRLPDGASLSAWLGVHGLEPPQPDAAVRAAHPEALALRAVLRRQAERMAAGKEPTGSGIAAVNAVLAAAPVVGAIVREGRGFGSAWQTVARGPPGVLFPVADSFRVFLETADPRLVRKCRNPACIRFFYDATRNRSRRWCSMQTCGNRAKGAAYYRRHR